MGIDDIKKLRRHSVGLTLPNEVNGDGTPVVVDVYIDDANHRAYQLDETNRRYRVGDSSTGGAYGEWIRFG